MATTFEAAEKFFFCKPPASSRPAFSDRVSGGLAVRALPEPERSLSPTDADSYGEEPSVGLDQSGQEGSKKNYGATWLRRHVKKNVSTGVYSSHDSFLNRVRGGGVGGANRCHGSLGGLAPLFEEHALSGYRDTYSHQPYSTRLAASDANLNLRRYNSSLSLFSGGGGDGGYFSKKGSKPLRMATRLFGSSPQLNGKHGPGGSKPPPVNPMNGEKLPDIKTMSVPQDINLNGTVDPPSNGKLPSISDNPLTVGSDTQTDPRRRKRRHRVKRVGQGVISSDGTTSTGTMTTTTTGSVQKTATTVTTTNDEEEEEDEGTELLSEDCIIDPYDTQTSTTESAYVPPEGGPDATRLEAERVAEEEVKHNWLLDEDNKSRMKRFESRCNRLTIHVADEDTVDAIEDRLEELRMMAKPRKDERSVLDRLSDEQREKILRMNEIPIATLRKGRRKGWKEAMIIAKAIKSISRPIHKLRWASSMICLLSRGVQERKQYVNKASEMGQMRRRLEAGEEETTTDPGTPDKPSLGLDLLLALTTRPHLRTTKTVKRILWLLRATKAFKNLFPAEMEMELAKVVGYERYDDGRIITKQGRAPDRFYYIISGKIGLFRQYQLSTGQVTKGMGFLTKGMTTDPEMMEKQRCREDSLVAKGQVEVLIVDKDAFSYLQHTTVGPPIDFLKSLDLFEEFPVERFGQSPDAIEYTYYGTGKVIVKDSNRTPWLHIVKSGRVKVVRSQSVIDARASNESKFVTPRIEALGCGKPFSHAGAMLGVQAKQRKLKSTAQVTLPQSFFLTRGGKKLVKQIQREPHLVVNPFSTTIGVESLPPSSPHSADRPSSHRRSQSRQSKKSRRSKKSREDEEEREEGRLADEEEAGEKEKQDREKDADIAEVSPSQEGEPQNPPPGEPPQGQEAEVGEGQEVEQQQEEGQETGGDGLHPPEGDTTRHSAAQKRRRKDATLPIINIPTRDPGEPSSYNPHPLWLTRERTDETGIFMAPDQKRTKEQAHRQAYLQLGVLEPGDVFCRTFFPSPSVKVKEQKGLDHMQPALASEAQGVSLLSDGAEVIKISKRFFLQNAGNNTMLKVETMCNEYISEEEAQQVLFDKETWSQYKHALWERMTAGLPQVPTQ